MENRRQINELPEAISASGRVKKLREEDSNPHLTAPKTVVLPIRRSRIGEVEFLCYSIVRHPAPRPSRQRPGPCPIIPTVPSLSTVYTGSGGRRACRDERACRRRAGDSAGRGGILQLSGGRCPLPSVGAGQGVLDSSIGCRARPLHLQSAMPRSLL